MPFLKGIEVKWDDSAPYEEDPDYREEEIEEILANSDMTAGELVGLMEDRLSSVGPGGLGCHALISRRRWSMR